MNGEEKQGLFLGFLVLLSTMIKAEVKKAIHSLSPYKLIIHINVNVLSTTIKR